ncbi:MAG: indole-3-glycerol-phosphate synthase [Desulfovibrionaceae bacterium]|nr:indole-3-glycerol-phosphate synthase [Desulfovibrionaceae bacterium]
MLERFRQIKDQEIARLKELDKSHGLPKQLDIKRIPFSASLVPPQNAPLAIIAEYKRASPSLGAICLDLEVEDVVLAYAQGAQAISILTEEVYFQGHLTFLDRAKAALGHKPIPLLRKDFIYDPIQIAATAATSASAVLLIVRMLPDAQSLAVLIHEAAHFGLESVVEVFDATDLEIARQACAKIIQVNTRDLETLKVDREGAWQLIQDHPPRDDETWILASGLQDRSDLVRASQAGFKAALIGTKLMLGGNPKQALQDFLGGDSHAD